MFEIVFQHDPSKKEGRERPTDAETARTRLIDGNARFSRLWSEDSRDSQKLVVPSNLKDLLPSEIGERELAVSAEGVRVTHVMIECGFAPSTGAATRLIDQGSVKIDGGRVEDRWLRIAPEQGPFVLQVGKRRVIRIKPSPA